MAADHRHHRTLLCLARGRAVRRLRRGWKRLIGTISGFRHDPELADEIETHLQMQTEDNLKLGMTAQEARRDAVLKFGGVEPAKELCRDQRGFPLIGNVRRDIRAAFRMLHRAPSVSVPAILVLALGTGTAIALYAIVYAMWLRPLPYPDAGRLVSVTTYFGEYKLDALASPDYGTWQGTRSLGALAGYSVSSAAMIAPDQTVEIGRARISGNLLDVLQIHAAIGRCIQPADDSPKAPQVAMLSEGLWRDQFGADPNVAGRSARIDGDAYTIIGVLPHGFRLPNEGRVDLLTPLALSESWLRHGSGGAMKILYGVGRLQPGVTLDQALAELSTRLANSRAQDPKIYGEDVSVRVVPLHEYVVRDVRTVAILLMGAVASILLIASANVASLLVARAAGREREMAVRVALGASASQIVQHLLIEGLTLGIIGVACGLAVARALIALAPRLLPAMLVRVEGVTVNREVLMAAFGTGLICSLAFSLAPVMPLPRLRVRRALVTGELAVSLMLLVASALLLENLAKLHSVSPGFRTEQLVTASLSLKGTRFAETPGELQRELRERLQFTPGIISIGFADALPPAGSGRITAFSRAGRPLPEPFQGKDNVIVRLVDATFFQAMGIPLLEGRVFTEADQTGNGLVAVVNRTLADRYFAGESPIGKQVDGLGVPWKTVAGVVRDTRNDGLQNPTRPEIYLPLTTNNARGGGITHDKGLHVVIRSAGGQATAISALRGHLRAMDRALLAKVRMMDEQWEDLQSGPRFQAAIFSGFAALALIMACTGVYGVLSHVVVLRRREIGIRMALGARPADVQGLVVREALILALGGAGIGIAGALAGSRILASLLYQVDPRDPLTLAGTAALLVVLACGASLAPAWRASRQNPAETLRAE
jgi:putative ABC transport system permease protein